MTQCAGQDDYVYHDITNCSSNNMQDNNLGSITRKLASFLCPPCCISNALWSMDRLQNGYIIVFTASHKNSLQHLRQYQWPMSSSQHEVTYHYATHCVPHSVCRDRAFESFARSHVLQFRRILRETKIFQLKSQEACLSFAETNAHYFLSYMQEKILIGIHLSLEAYIFMEDLGAFPFQPYKSPGKVLILKSSAATKTPFSSTHWLLWLIHSYCST